MSLLLALINPIPNQPMPNDGAEGGGYWKGHRNEEERKKILEQEHEIILAVIHAAMKIIK